MPRCYGGSHATTTRLNTCEGEADLTSDIYRDLPLHYKILRGTLIPYLTHRKAGYNDRYERTAHSRGGSKRIALASRYRQEALAQGDDTRVQGVRRLASETLRPGRL